MTDGRMRTTHHEVDEREGKETPYMMFDFRLGAEQWPEVKTKKPLLHLMHVLRTRGKAKKS